MLKKSRIIIIRHGETIGNMKKWYYGQADISLSDNGRFMTRKNLKDGVYPVIPDSAQCFTTGLVRTEETFMIIYGDRPHGRLESLKEMNFGEYECHSWDELQDDPIFLEWGYDTTGDVALPEGESRNQFVRRISRGLDDLIAKHNIKELELRHKDEEAVTVLICHGGVITVIMNLLFPDEAENPWAFMPKPGTGYELNFSDGKPITYKKIEGVSEKENG